MASHYSFLNSESINQYPYIDKISVGEETRVDFIYQYVKGCNNYCDINYCTTIYILGEPTKFPNYGNFPEIFIKVCIFPDIICYCPPI